MKQLIITFFLMSGICYGQTTYSALVIQDSLKNRIEIKSDSSFKITNDKSNIVIHGDTMDVIIIMAQKIKDLLDEKRYMVRCGRK